MRTAQGQRIGFERQLCGQWWLKCGGSSSTGEGLAVQQQGGGWERVVGHGNGCTRGWLHEGEGIGYRLAA